MRRFIFMMLDGVGVGALPDAAEYGDAGSDTLGNLSRVVEMDLPFLGRLGLGNILPLIGVPPAESPMCLPGRLAPHSVGKDTTVGHWEHMGLVTAKPFPTYPQGFPEEVLVPFVRRIGRDVLGNKPASGTAIIAELGSEHLSTGKPIVYTSADSVFQIAAHVDVVPLATLYEWCEIAREILQGPHAVARVIARPFAGPADAFYRTKDRRDYSLPPPGPTYLDLLHGAGVPVLALGKISEIFGGRGVTHKAKVASNTDNLALTLDLIRGRPPAAAFSAGLLFTNLVDFDMSWGHRNDADGFTSGLVAVDQALPDLLAALSPEDRLIISADHGVDPTTVSTDHSREYVPLLLYPRPAAAPAAVFEGSFADTGATIYEFLVGNRPPLSGRPITELRPSRGWRRYTSTQPAATGMGSEWSVRLGSAEMHDAAEWLRKRLGRPPEVAVVLGSGLVPALDLDERMDVPYEQVPHWRVGSVPGHAYVLTVARWIGSVRLALLTGRIHGYEGFDLSELQQQVRTLAAWGVPRALITTASGGVSPGVLPGTTVIAGEVIDLQFSPPSARPLRLTATDSHFAAKVLSATAGVASRQDAASLILGIHAAVPGPQYETPAEISLLQALGATCVSMSGAAEIRAARDEGLQSALICQITNAGATSHQEVLAATRLSREAFTTAVVAVLSAWGLTG